MTQILLCFTHYLSSEIVNLKTTRFVFVGDMNYEAIWFFVDAFPDIAAFWYTNNEVAYTLPALSNLVIFKEIPKPQHTAFMARTVGTKIKRKMGVAEFDTGVVLAVINFDGLNGCNTAADVNTAQLDFILSFHPDYCVSRYHLTGARAIYVGGSMHALPYVGDKVGVANVWSRSHSIRALIDSNLECFSHHPYIANPTLVVKDLINDLKSVSIVGIELAGYFESSYEYMMQKSVVDKEPVKQTQVKEKNTDKRRKKK